MWIFYSGGMLLPSLAPMDKADPKLTKNGKLTMQVRARDAAHLRNLIKDYLKPRNIEHSKIENTPWADYTSRIYLRPEDFAAVVSLMVMDIDYRKFKETSERKNANGKPRYSSGRDYHDLLLQVWGTVALWRRPGGYWGKVYSPPRQHQRDGHTPRSTFFDELADWDTIPSAYESGVEDYMPSSAERKELLLDRVSGLPTSEWAHWLSAEELTLVHAEFEKARKLERKAPVRRRRGRKGRVA